MKLTLFITKKMGLLRYGNFVTPMVFGLVSNGMLCVAEI